MAGLVVRQVTGFSPRLRAADGISFISGDHGRKRVVVRTGRARPGRVMAAVAGPKYRRYRGAAAVTVPETSRELLDQQNVRPSNTAWNQLTTTITRLASIITYCLVSREPPCIFFLN